MVWDQEIAGSSPVYPTMANKTLTVKDICDGYTGNLGFVWGTGVQYDSSVANKLITHGELEQYGAISGESSDKAKKVVSTADFWYIPNEYYMTIAYTASWKSGWSRLRIYVTYGSDTLGEVTLSDSGSGSFTINYNPSIEGKQITYHASPSGSETIPVAFLSYDSNVLKYSGTNSIAIT